MADEVTDAGTLPARLMQLEARLTRVEANFELQRTEFDRWRDRIAVALEEIHDLHTLVTSAAQGGKG